MKVFIITVYADEAAYDTLWAGLKSVWTTKEGAEAEIQRFMDKEPFAWVYDDFHIHEMEMSIES